MFAGLMYKASSELLSARRFPPMAATRGVSSSPSLPRSQWSLKRSELCPFASRSRPYADATTPALPASSTRFGQTRPRSDGQVARGWPRWQTNWRWKQPEGTLTPSARRRDTHEAADQFANWPGMPRRKARRLAMAFTRKIGTRFILRPQS